jgi:outer membrane biosynthesis protein TonB
MFGSMLCMDNKNSNHTIIKNTLPEEMSISVDKAFDIISEMEKAEQESETISISEYDIIPSTETDESQKTDETQKPDILSKLEKPDILSKLEKPDETPNPDESPKPDETDESQTLVKREETESSSQETESSSQETDESSTSQETDKLDETSDSEMSCS